MLVYGGSTTAYVLVVAGVLGLVVGSFVNCWAWRSVNGESIVRGRSHCTSCGHDLGALDLVPVFSWLFSRGRCRYCGSPVSVRYPLAELVCAISFVGIVFVYGLTLETAELLLFASILLFLSLTDIDDFTIPNGCIVAAVVVRVAYLAACWAQGAIYEYQVLFYVGSALGMGAVLSAVVLVADRVFGRESMGGGDLKLYAVAGLYFGWQQGIYLVVLSCLIGILTQLLRPQGSRSRADRPSREAGRPSVRAARAQSSGEGAQSSGGARVAAQAPVRNYGRRDVSEFVSGFMSEVVLESLSEGAAPASPAAGSAASSAARREPSDALHLAIQPASDAPRPAPFGPVGEPGSGAEGESRLSKPFPFGPSIAAACVITMLIGAPFVTWYLGLL